MDRAIINSFKEEIDCLYAIHRVERQPAVDSAVAFGRLVVQNIPVHFTNACEKLCTRWDNEHLADHLGEQLVSVTPDGLADAIRQDVFALPDHEMMSFDELLSKLADEDPGGGDVWYLQTQNGNLVAEELLADVKSLPAVAAATEFLGEASACNIWYGGRRSITCVHADPFENVYLVLRGAKHFTLWPPCDQMFFERREYTTSQWRRDEHGRWLLEPVEGAPPTKWLAHKVDSEPPPGSSPVHVTVSAGEALYLPAFWLHEVRQEDDTLAVNCWFEASFSSPVYALSVLSEALSEVVASGADGRELP